MIQSKLVISIGCVLASATVFSALSHIFFLNTSQSLPVGLYVRIPCGEYQRGDYIVYEPDEATKTLVRRYGWNDNPGTFLKIVGGIAGDRYSVEESTRFFTIGDKFIGIAYETDTKGHPLPQISGDFTVEEGQILPVGTAPRSFDGRYTGTIPITSVKAKVKPLLTK